MSIYTPTHRAPVPVLVIDNEAHTFETFGPVPFASMTQEFFHNTRTYSYKVDVLEGSFEVRHLNMSLSDQERLHMVQDFYFEASMETVKVADIPDNVPLFDIYTVHGFTYPTALYVDGKVWAYNAQHRQMVSIAVEEIITLAFAPGERPYARTTEDSFSRLNDEHFQSTRAMWAQDTDETEDEAEAEDEVDADDEHGGLYDDCVCGACR